MEGWNRIMILAAAALAAAAADAVEFAPARAVVTTTGGGSEFRSASGKTTRPALHEVLVPEGGRLSVPPGGRLALSLSNGLGLAVDGGTHLGVERFSQTPFDASRESLLYEPSISGLRLWLADGAIALIHPEPSPLSEFAVATPTGEFRFHRGRAVIVADISGTRIFMDEGAGTFVYPDGIRRTFMASGSALLASSYSASRGEPALRDEAVPREASFSALGGAAARARGRVLHRATDEASEAAPFALLAPVTAKGGSGPAKDPTP